MARSEEQLASVARRFAPVLVLHPDDAWAPIDPLAFIGACELRLGAKAADKVVVPRGKIQSELLGSGSGASSYQATKSELGQDVAAWQLSRPFDKHPARVAGLDGRSGFFLALVDETVAPPLAEAHMLYEWKDDTLLCYWWCLAGSSLPQHVLSAIEGAIGGVLDPSGLAATAVSTQQEALLALIGSGAQPELLQTAEAARDLVGSIDRLDEVHEGDWEGVTMRFEGDRPVTVELHQHGRAAPVPFEQLDHVGERPVVYCARGSHSTVGSPAAAGDEEVAAHGPRWEPEAALIVNARAQPWYGFGGAWGRRQRPPLGEMPPLVRTIARWVSGFDVWEESTGPLGPSPYKLR